MNKMLFYSFGGALLAQTALMGAANAAPIVMVSTAAPAPEPETAPKTESEPPRSSTSKLEGRMTIAEAMVKTGTNSPSEALHQLKKQNSRYGYIPHVGARQRAKEARRQERAAAKAAAR